MEDTKYNISKQIWEKLYLTYNDDNESHCENAFISNHYETVADIEDGIQSMITEIIDRGESKSDIISKIPESTVFCESLSKSNEPELDSL